MGLGIDKEKKNDECPWKNVGEQEGKMKGDIRI